MRPTFEAAWLEPGMHVTMLGPREVSEEVLARCDVKIVRVLPGSGWASRNGCGRRSGTVLWPHRRNAGGDAAAIAQGDRSGLRR